MESASCRAATQEKPLGPTTFSLPPALHGATAIISGERHSNDVGAVPVEMLSAASLVATDAFNLLGLHESIRTAQSGDALASEVAIMPALFVRLVDARLRTPTRMRIYTTLCDAITSRLIELSIEQRGAPPVAFAWLAFGSAGRGELRLVSDQDNGLAYADTDDPSVDEYFLQLAIDVNQGLHRCGFPLDPHGVLATDSDWRMQASDWVAQFADCLKSWDNDHLLRAAVGFDVRQVAGDLRIIPLLADVISEAPGYSRFLLGMAQLGAEIPSPLGFRRRLRGPVDLKWRCLLPIQNLARYYACAAGVARSSTLERLATVRDAAGKGSEVAEPLREAFVTIAGLVDRQQADAFAAGRSTVEALDGRALDAEARAQLEAALRLLASVQEGLPRRAAI
jgi:CBS domain-containing protein